MAQSKIDIAKSGSAPTATHCVIIGEASEVRIAFLTGADTNEPVGFLTAVTLTRSQLTGFAGMVAAVLDADDPNAVSLN